MKCDDKTNCQTCEVVVAEERLARLVDSQKKGDA